MAIGIASVVDNGNGTATITAAGASSGGATITAYTAAVTSLLTLPQAWTSAGTCTGNSTIIATLAPGFYFVTLTDSGGTLPALSAWIHCSNAPLDNWDACQLSIQATIQALGLTFGGVTIPNTQIQIRKFPVVLVGDTTPLILIGPARETADPTAGVTDKDDIGYGIIVSVNWQSNQDITATQMPDELLARQRIRKAFHNQALVASGNILAWKTVVEPGPPYDYDAWGKNLDAGAIVIRATCRETRGLT